ncbi:hypothetical protein PRZ48_009557 [Zasmidium cellare]|uniref:GATA-type domain-containing protein n=1 Tax=Zasmidium cellare TaxID=395010 RepID=A0ABR0ECQ0_ZASCE|nr:hypothetical protein PRZ48_009557 [Zasmidium cellare]
MDRRNERDEPEGDESEVDDLQQLELDRNHNDQKLKSRFEHIFRKYEHDFEGIGDEIEIASGDIVVDNGHLQHMRHEADPGKSASSRFVSTFKEKLGDEDESSLEDDDDDDDEDTEDDDEEEGSGSDETSETTQYRQPQAHAPSRPRQRQLSPRKAMSAFGHLERPAPRLAHLLVGEGTPQHSRDVAADTRNQDDSSIESTSGTSTPTNILAQVPGLQDSMRALQPRAKRSAVDPEAIEALGVSIANQLAQLMAGPSKSKRKEARTKEKRAIKQSVWDYPDLGSKSRKKRRRSPSPIALPLPSSPAPGSPGEESLWAPEGSVRPSKRLRREREQPRATPAVTRSKRLQLPSSGTGTSRKEVKRCWNCSLTSTPSWHEGPHGQDLCESCARYYLHNRRMKPFDSPTPSVEDEDELEDSVIEVGASNVQERSQPRSPQAAAPANVAPASHITPEQTDEDADEHDAVWETQLSNQSESYFYRPIPTNIPDHRSNVPPSPGSSRTHNQVIPQEAHSQRHSPGERSERHLQRLVHSHDSTHESGSSRSQAQHVERRTEDYPRSSQNERQDPQLLGTHHEHHNGPPNHGHTQVHHAIGTSTAAGGTAAQQPQAYDSTATFGAVNSQFGIQPGSAYMANTSRTLITSPSRRKGNFSIEEDVLIIRLKEQERMTWEEITAYFPHRTPFAVSGRYNRELKFPDNPARAWLDAQANVSSDDDDEGADPVLSEDLAWNTNQDELLLELREDQELEWDEISNLLPGHSPEAVEERYELLAQRGLEQHYQKHNLPTLNPEAYEEAEEKHANANLYFSPEEDALIVRLKEIEGLQWSQIAKQLRGRALYSIQRRYSRVLAPKVRKNTPTSKFDHVQGSMEDRLLAVDPQLSGVAGVASWSREEDHVIKISKEDQHLSWDLIAQRLPGRTADDVRHRYEYKFLAEALAAREEAERLAKVAAQEYRMVKPTTSYPGMGFIAFDSAPPPPSPPATPTAVQHPSGHTLSQTRQHSQHFTRFHPSPQQFVINNATAVTRPPEAALAPPESAPKSSRAGPGSRTPFTEDEDDAILHLREMQGLSWDDIAARLPGRSVNSISSRYAEAIRPAARNRVSLDPTVSFTTVRNPSHLSGQQHQPLAAPSASAQHIAHSTPSQGSQHITPASASSSRHESSKSRSQPARKSLPSALPSASRSQNPLLRKALDNSLRRRSDIGSTSTSLDQNVSRPKTTYSRDPEAPSQQLLREMESSFHQTPPPRARASSTTMPPRAQEEDSSSESSEGNDDQMYHNLMHAAKKFALERKNPALFNRVKEIYEKNPDDERLHQLLRLASASSSSTSELLSAFEHIVDPSPPSHGGRNTSQRRARTAESGTIPQDLPVMIEKLPVRAAAHPPAPKQSRPGGGASAASSSTVQRKQTSARPPPNELGTTHYEQQQRQDTDLPQSHSTGRPRRAAAADASRKNSELYALPVEHVGDADYTPVPAANAPSRARSNSIDRNMPTGTKPSASPGNQQAGIVFVPEGKKLRGRPRRSNLDWSPYEAILKAFRTSHRDFMPLRDIYAAVEADEHADGNWKLAIRTALNKKPCFERAIDYQGHSGWQFTPGAEERQDLIVQEPAASSAPQRHVTFNHDDDGQYMPQDNETIGPDSTSAMDVDETMVVNVAPKQRRIVPSINAGNVKNTSFDDGTVDDLAAPTGTSLGQFRSPGQPMPRQETPVKSILKRSGTSKKATPRVIEIANSDDEDELSPEASVHDVDKLELPTSPPSRRTSLDALHTSDINRDPLSSDAAAEPVVRSSGSKRTGSPNATALSSSSPLFMKPKTPASALTKKAATPRPSASRLPSVRQETPLRTGSPAIFMSRSASVASARRSSLGKRVVETPVREVDSDEDELA